MQYGLIEADAIFKVCLESMSITAAVPAVLVGLLIALIFYSYYTVSNYEFKGIKCNPFHFKFHFLIEIHTFKSGFNPLVSGVFT